MERPHHEIVATTIVTEEGEETPFAYTTGMDSMEFLDLCIYGVYDLSAAMYLTAVAELYKKGKVQFLEVPIQFPGTCAKVMVKLVSKRQSGFRFGKTKPNAWERDMLQVVRADICGKFPWEEHYCATTAQPLLFNL